MEYETRLKINGIEKDVIVDFDAFKEEPMTWDYPGYPAYIEINCILDKETEKEYYLPEEEERLKKIILDWLSDQGPDNYYDEY